VDLPLLFQAPVWAIAGGVFIAVGAMSGRDEHDAATTAWRTWWFGLGAAILIIVLFAFTSAQGLGGTALGIAWLESALIAYAFALGGATGHLIALYAGRTDLAVARWPVGIVYAFTFTLLFFQLGFVDGTLPAVAELSILADTMLVAMLPPFAIVVFGHAALMVDGPTRAAKILNGGRAVVVASTLVSLAAALGALARSGSAAGWSLTMLSLVGPAAVAAVAWSIFARRKARQVNPSAERIAH